MAVVRDQEAKDEVAKFVQKLYALSGAKSWNDFAYRAGVHPVNLSTWQTAKVMPEGWNLYSLVKASGLIERASQSPPGEEDPELVSELEELADLLERLQQLGSSIGRRAGGSS